MLRWLLLWLLVVPCLGAFSAAAAPARLARGPYLQLTTPTSVHVKWRTDVASISEVRYGTSPGDLNNASTGTLMTNRHGLVLTNLLPATRYYYSVGGPGTILTNGPDLFFQTAPASGSRLPMRIWALGDSGFTNQFAAAVRDAYFNYTGTRHTDVWLMLGDNAYTGGTDGLYQNAVFDTYPTLLRRTTLWSTIGNQETGGLANPPLSIAYFEIFSFPTQGEAGGEPSGSERYYSFDYGNVHFICLDSMSSSRAPGSPMMTWLEADLLQNTSDWTIAFWHHPPYSKGNRDSDVAMEQVEMRLNAVTLLETYGVDVVLTGHCHSYERSYLLDGHYGLSTTFLTNYFKNPGDGRLTGSGAYTKSTLGPASHEGAVYVVAGSGSSLNSGPFNHPVMHMSKSVPGSVVIDVHANRMEAKFLRDTGQIDDSFTIIKGAAAGPLTVQATQPDATHMKLSWATVADRTYRVQHSDDPGPPWDEVGAPIIGDGDTATVVVTFGPGSARGFYRVYTPGD